MTTPINEQQVREALQQLDWQTEYGWQRVVTQSLAGGRRRQRRTRLAAGAAAVLLSGAALAAVATSPVPSAWPATQMTPAPEPSLPAPKPSRSPSTPDIEVPGRVGSPPPAVEGHPDYRAAVGLYVACMADAGYEVADTAEIFQLVGPDHGPQTNENRQAEIAAFEAHDTCLAPVTTATERLRALNRGDAVPAEFACPALVPSSLPGDSRLGGETPLERDDWRDPTHQWETVDGPIRQLAGGDSYSLYDAWTEGLLVEGQPASLLPPTPGDAGQFVLYVQVNGCSYTTLWPRSWSEAEVLTAARSMTLS